jgi:ABC-type cobalt transport system substrate-binding protein
LKDLSLDEKKQLFIGSRIESQAKAVISVITLQMNPLFKSVVDLPSGCTISILYAAMKSALYNAEKRKLYYASRQRKWYRDNSTAVKKVCALYLYCLPFVTIGISIICIFRTRR